MGKEEKATPETRKVKVLNDALEDIDDIIDYIAIANKQPLNAIKVAEYI